MASKSKGSAHTAPKGHATPGQGGGTGERRLLTPTMQWLIAIVVGLAILGGIMYMLRDQNAGIGLGDQSGAAPTAPAVFIAPPDA